MPTEPDLLEYFSQPSDEDAAPTFGWFDLFGRLFRPESIHSTHPDDVFDPADAAAQELTELFTAAERS
jgi:hypothetical protein